MKKTDIQELSDDDDDARPLSLSNPPAACPKPAELPSAAEPHAGSDSAVPVEDKVPAVTQQPNKKPAGKAKAKGKVSKPKAGAKNADDEDVDAPSSSTPLKRPAAALQLWCRTAARSQPRLNFQSQT